MKTYADIARKLGRKMNKFHKMSQSQIPEEQRTGTRMGERTSQELDELFYDQEMTKMSLGKGGKLPKYKDGGPTGPSYTFSWDRKPWTRPFVQNATDLLSGKGRLGDILSNVGSFLGNFNTKQFDPNADEEPFMLSSWGKSSVASQYPGTPATNYDAPPTVRNKTLPDLGLKTNPTPTSVAGGSPANLLDNLQETPTEYPVRDLNFFERMDPDDVRRRVGQFSQLIPEAYAFASAGKVEVPEPAKMKRVTLDKTVPTREEEASAMNMQTNALDRMGKRGKVGRSMYQAEGSKANQFLNKVYQNKRRLEIEQGNREEVMNMQVDRANVDIENRNRIQEMMRERGILADRVGALSSAAEKFARIMKEDTDLRTKTSEMKMVLKAFDHSGISDEYLMEFARNILKDK